MKALLIGGSGPTGPHVIAGLLARDVQLTVLNRGLRDRAPDGVESIVADPHFLESLEPALRNRSFDLVIATYGRLRIMPALLAAITDRVITVGGTAYADTGGVPATEDTARDTRNALIARLVETEQLLTQAHEDGLFVHTHLRYPLLWGPGQLAPKEWCVIRRVLDGRSFIPMVDGGLTIESKCFVKNAAQAVLLAADRTDLAAGRTYNVSDAIAPSDSMRVADLCAELGHPEIGQLSLPQRVTGPAAFWGIGRDLDAALEQRPASTAHQLVDSSRIRTELGYEDMVEYAEAVRVTTRHYQQHPLEYGGADERKINDPFDYPAEDAYAQALDAFTEACDAITFTAGGFIHQYDHPTQPRTGN
jgi:nucleoside-diphosphate-sugar epimerase